MNKAAVVLFAGAAFFCACANAPVVAVKPGFDLSKTGRVALLDFADFQGQDGSGQVASQALEPYLLKSGYNLIERSQVQRILQEQSFNQSNMVAPNAIATLGKLLSVDTVVLGRVTGFVSEYSRVYMQNVRNVAYDPVYQAVQYKDSQGAVRSRQVISHYDVTTTNEQIPATYQTPATVAFSAKLVNAATGEVLWTGSVSAMGDTSAVAADAAAKRLSGALKKATKS